MTTSQTADSKPLPPGWKWARLGDVALVNPRRPRGLSYPESLPTTFVPMPSVSGERGAITSSEIRDFLEVSRGYTYFEEEDVLFAKITPCMQNGKHAIARDLMNGFGFGSTEFHVIRAGEELAPEWVHRFLRQPYLLEEAKKHFRGAVGQQRVPKEFLVDLTLPLPPLSEQQRIAAILNQQMASVERAKKAAQARLEAAQALGQALLRTAFPVQGQELPPSWKWTRLGDVCIQDRVTVKVSDPVALTLRYIGIENIESNSGQFLLEGGTSSVQGQVKSNTFKFDSRHILYSKLRPYLNKVATPEFSGRCSTELIPLLGTDVDKSYLAVYLRLPETANYAVRTSTGSRMPRTDMQDFMGLLVPLAPLYEQQRIVAVLNQQMTAVERARKAAREQLAEIETLPSALLGLAFSGEL